MQVGKHLPPTRPSPATQGREINVFSRYAGEGDGRCFTTGLDLVSSVSDYLIDWIPACAGMMRCLGLGRLVWFGVGFAG